MKIENKIIVELSMEGSNLLAEFIQYNHEDLEDSHIMHPSNVFCLRLATELRANNNEKR